tara:strand:+ start:55 stop:321 length:267 start_codon:yes stop_codon:yes gene_type:complete
MKDVPKASGLGTHRGSRSNSAHQDSIQGLNQAASMSALAMAAQINQKSMNPSAPPEKKRQVATAMKKGQKNEITGLTIMNPSFNHETI